MLDELARQVKVLPEEELLRIATTDREEYVPEALALVQAEIERRGLENVSSTRYLELKSERESREERARPRLVRWLAWMFQTTASESSALRVMRQGAIASWVIGAHAFVGAVLKARVGTVASQRLGLYLLLGSVIYVALGFGIWAGSLIAALTVLLVLVGVCLYGWAAWGLEPSGVALFVFIALLNGVRGARALRRFRSTGPQELEASPFPTISSEVVALRVTRQGAVAAWVVSGGTLLWLILTAVFEARALQVQLPFPSFSSSLASVLATRVTFAHLAAALLLGYGFAIWKGSFPASVLGLLVYVCGCAYMWYAIEREPGATAFRATSFWATSFWATSFLLGIAFVNGLRGAKALRMYRTGEAGTGENSGTAAN